MALVGLVQEPRRGPLADQFTRRASRRSTGPPPSLHSTLHRKCSSISCCRPAEVVVVPSEGKTTPTDDSPHIPA
eukprot:9070543-Alexandrium_andersonii.AAC.1